MPPSRRKACLACVQSKRRCDKTVPNCRRCVARKTACEYNNDWYPVSLPQQATGSNDNEVISFAAPFAESFAEQIPSNLQLQQSPLLLPGLTIPSPYQANDFLGLGIDPFNLASMSQDDVVFNSPAAGAPNMQHVVAQQLRSDSIVQLISDPGPTQVRVDYAARRLFQAPQTFASLGQTSFIHRTFTFTSTLSQANNQSQSPACSTLQDALSTCALYCLKTPMNSVLVYGNLQHRRQHLLTHTNHTTASHTELLAALQALILYQIMSLFDGDVRLRAQAEADEHVMMTWAMHLRSRIPYASTPPVEITWHRWLVEESTHRTVITAFLLKGVYHFLKFGFDIVPDLCMSFTAQARLWHAQDEGCWRRAARETEMLLVKVPRWDEVMGRARPEDLEELGVLLMAMLKGVDATREWLGEGFVARYGVEGVGLGLI